MTNTRSKMCAELFTCYYLICIINVISLFHFSLSPLSSISARRDSCSLQDIVSYQWLPTSLAWDPLKWNTAYFVLIFTHREIICGKVRLLGQETFKLYFFEWILDNPVWLGWSVHITWLLHCIYLLHGFALILQSFYERKKVLFVLCCHVLHIQ